MESKEKLGWTCQRCGTFNLSEKLVCDVCDSPRPADIPVEEDERIPKITDEDIRRILGIHEHSEEIPADFAEDIIELASSDTEIAEEEESDDREERNRRLGRILWTVQRVVLFLIIISSFLLMAYNIFEAEKRGSSAAIAAERIAAFSVLHKGAEALQQRYEASVSQIRSTFGMLTQRFNYFAENLSRLNEFSISTRAAALQSKADNVRQIAMVRIRSISIFARQSFSSAADRFSALITQCGRTVTRIYSSIQ